MNLERLDIGIIGTGKWARVHAAAYSKSKDARIVAVAGRDMFRAQKFANEADAQYSYDDYLDLLDNEDVDAVSIVVPPKYAPSIVVEAARRKKHILCEKPLSLTYKEAIDVYTAVQKHGVTMHVSLDRRFNPLMARLKQFCEEGRFGEPKVITSFRQLVHLTEYPLSSWRFNHEEGGGVLCIMVHDFDLAHWITGLDITSVTVYGGCLFNEINCEDYCLVALQMENKVMAKVEAYFNNRSSWSFAVQFQNARVEADIRNAQLRIIGKDGVQIEHLEQVLTVDRSVQHFLNSILNNTESSISKEDVLQNVRVLEVARDIVRKALNSKGTITSGFNSIEYEFE